jgi:hypothetical protein
MIAADNIMADRVDTVSVRYRGTWESLEFLRPERSTLGSPQR